MESYSEQNGNCLVRIGMVACHQDVDTSQEFYGSGLSFRSKDANRLGWESMLEVSKVKIWFQINTHAGQIILRQCNITLRKMQL